MKTLYLVRHAKSDWSDGTLKDFDRPLNKRGKKDAPQMGLHLKSVRNVALDGVLCSTAKRARSTAKRLLKGLDYSVEDVMWEEGIYWGNTTDLVHLIQQVDAHCNALMLIGHNPYVSDLVGFLQGQEIGDMPTCGVFGLSLDIDAWSEITSGKGKKLFFDCPKQI